MARIRSIKPEFFIDEDVASLGFAARLFFIALWCHADREGRLEDKPKQLAIQIVPFDIGKEGISGEGLLSELCPRFIVRYEASGKRLIQIRNFSKHQRPHPNEAESVFEKPTESGDVSPKNEQSLNGDTQQVRKGREGKGRERKGKEGEQIAPSQEGSGLPVMVFPTNGKAKEWGLRQETVDSLKADFPGVDVLAQCRTARAWCEANPAKRKTAGGMMRFLVSWMSRQQDRGVRPAQGNPQPVRIVGGAAPVQGKYDHL